MEWKGYQMKFNPIFAKASQSTLKISTGRQTDAAAKLKRNHNNIIKVITLAMLSAAFVHTADVAQGIKQVNQVQPKDATTTTHNGMNIFQAIQRNNFDALKHLIEVDRVDVNATTQDGATPIFIAISYGMRLNMIKLLVEHGANVNYINEQQMTPLLQAASPGFASNTAIVTYLVEHGADVNYQRQDGITALMKASDVDKVACLVEYGAHINHEAQDGSTPLIKLAYYGFNQVTYLVKRGADVNHKTKNGITALMRAVENNQLETSIYLIEHGADVNAADNNGNTVLMKAVAAHNKWLPIIKMLVDSGAHVNAANTYGQTALMLIAQNYVLFSSNEKNNIEIAKYLVEHGAQINATDNYGQTALMYSVVPSISKYLIEHGADINHKSNNGQTALEKAELELHNLQIVNLLRQKQTEKNFNQAAAQTQPINTATLKIKRVLS